MQPTKLLPRAVQKPQRWVSMAHPLRRLTLLLPALCPPHSGSGAVAALGVLPADPLAAQAPQCDLATGQAMASLGAPRNKKHGRTAAPAHCTANNASARNTRPWTDWGLPREADARGLGAT